MPELGVDGLLCPHCFTRAASAYDHKDKYHCTVCEQWFGQEGYTIKELDGRGDYLLLCKICGGIVIPDVL